MVANLYYPQWRNENSLRAYPFEETSRLTDQTNRLAIPTQWLVDASLAPLRGTAPFSVGTIKLDSEQVAVSIVDSNRLTIGVGESLRHSISPIAIYDGQSLIGTLVVGESANYPLYGQGNGEFVYGTGYADFVLDTVFDLSNLTGLYGFEFEGQTYSDGDLVFVGEQGIQLTVEDTSEQSNDGQLHVQRLRVHAVGDPQFLSRECNEEAQRPTRFIREIIFQYGSFTHSCKPNNMGNILFLADSPTVDNPALQVLNTQQGILIHLAGKGL